MNSKRAPVGGPAAWTGAQLAERTDWVRPLTGPELDELDAALATALASGKHYLDLTRGDFPLRVLARSLAEISHELELGRGMVQMRGLPVERYGSEQLKALYWGLGLHLGVALSQSQKGDLVGEVVDLGVEMQAADARAYRSRGLSRFHTDRCDVVGLLCVVKAKSGGESRVVSSLAVHNEVLARRPDLMDELYGPFHHSRQGEEAPGERPYFACPVFAERDGVFASQLSFLYIESAQRFPDVPPLTERQKEALALVGEIANQLYLESPFEPGDLQLLNNRYMWHCRAGYEDHPELERRRLLYRLWLAPSNARALPDIFAESWGSVAAGTVRGGVISSAGWRDAISARSMRPAAE